MTIPIALFMGVYLRFLRPGKVIEVSIIGFILLLAAIIGGGAVAATEWGAEFFHLEPLTIAIGIVIYGFIAAILPVWLLLAPRDYLSTFMKIGTIVMLAVAIIIVRPELAVPAFSEFAATGEGPVVAGPLWPFLFVTIACGALSGFHALISSGTTPKLVEKERQTRMIGYGGMLMESFVAIMALVAALSIDQGIYFAMNSSAAATGGTVEGAVAFVNNLGITGVEIDENALLQTAKDVGEESIVSRTGGAPTLAVGLANIMQQLTGGGLMAFWYHFAIMFEALFILTAVDAGTRVARFMLQDSIGNFVPRFKDTSWRVGAWTTTAIMVAAWGAILVLGVTDPLGGINTFFPLFGIANQLLAAIALAICLAIMAKRGLFKYLWVVILPLGFASVITIWASILKIFSPIPAIGYFAQNGAFSEALASGETSFGTATSVEAMQAVIRNTMVQGVLSVLFVVLSIIVIATATWAAWRSYRSRDLGTSEDAAVPSRIFGPASFIPTRPEREIQAQWDARPTQKTTLGSRKAGH
jgi:carbon starvation protein